MQFFKLVMYTHYLGGYTCAKSDVTEALIRTKCGRYLSSNLLSSFGTKCHETCARGGVFLENGVGSSMKPVKATVTAVGSPAGERI